MDDIDDSKELVKALYEDVEAIIEENNRVLPYMKAIVLMNLS